MDLINIILLIILICLAIVDILTTEYGLKKYQIEEKNPVMKGIAGKPILHLIVKICALIVFISIIIIIDGYSSVSASIVLLIMILIYLWVQKNNIKMICRSKETQEK